MGFCKNYHYIDSLGKKWQGITYDSCLNGAVIQLHVIEVGAYGRENMIRVQ